MIVLRSIIPPITHFGARKVEWGVAAAMAGFCVVLAQPGESMTQPQFAVIHGWASETVWTWACGLIAAARFGALWINGAWGPSPVVRGATATLSSLFWLGLLLGVAASHRLATSLSLYPLLILADIDSVYHAASDWQAARERRTGSVVHARSAAR